MCEYECYRIAGPWIAENPDCPIHGRASEGRGTSLETILEAVHDGEISPYDAVRQIEEMFS